MEKYRKKPIVVEAIQYIEDTHTLHLLADFMGTVETKVVEGVTKLVVKTLEGEITANQGDYIIKGIKGEFYPCREDIFEETYDKV